MSAQQPMNTTVTAQLGCQSSPETARDYERGYACGWYDMMARAADIAATMGREDIELKIRAVERRGHAQTAKQPIDFFTNVDAWGAAEWFDRMAKAIREHDTAVLAGDDEATETYRMIAASSAMRLVREYEHYVRAALSDTSTDRLAPGCCSAISPCSHQRQYPSNICATCQAATVTSPEGKS